MPWIETLGCHLCFQLTSKSQLLVEQIMTMPNFDVFELYKIAVLFEVGDITARCDTESLTEMTTKMTLIRKATLLRDL